MNAERYERQGRVLSAVGISGLVIIAGRGIVALVTSDTESSALAAALAATVLACLVLLALATRARNRFVRATMRAAWRSPDGAGGGEPTAEATAEPRSEGTLSAARRGVAAVACLAAIAALTYAAAPPSLKKLRWTFLEPTTAPAELGLRPHASDGGEWHVEDDSHATGARALVNREGDPAGAPALLVATSAFTRDLRAVTRCKVAPDMAARACGVVFRFRGEGDYHVARLDSAGGMLVVSAMSNGHERVLGTREATIAPGVWQELSVEARGARVRLSLNGKTTLEVIDPAPVYPGNVGLWSPAAGVATFDELAVDPLPASAQAFELLPLLGKGRT
jgi:hypothetical protein